MRAKFDSCVTITKGNILLDCWGIELTILEVKEVICLGDWTFELRFLKKGISGRNLDHLILIEFCVFIELLMAQVALF